MQLYIYPGYGIQHRYLRVATAMGYIVIYIGVILSYEHDVLILHVNWLTACIYSAGPMTLLYVVYLTQGLYILLSELVIIYTYVVLVTSYMHKHLPCTNFSRYIHDYTHMYNRNA